MSDDLSKVGAVTLTADQAAMLRKVLAAIGGCGSVNHIHGHAYAPPQLIQEARAALALLPEPVDADLIEARKVVRENNQMASYNYEDGSFDATPIVQCALAAIRRGRALERDSREG